MHAVVVLRVSLLGAGPAKKPRFLIVRLTSCVLARCNADPQAQHRRCNHGQLVDDGDAQYGGGGCPPQRLICRCRGVSRPYHSFQSCRDQSYQTRQRRCRQGTGGEGFEGGVATCPCAMRQQQVPLPRNRCHCPPSLNSLLKRTQKSLP